ncbi:site-specific integrase, partial [Bifidobacterium longum]
MKDTENRPQPRKRRKWGSVIVRRDADGNPTSFQARYVNPLDPPKKVGRNFGLEYETEAYRWLDEERYLVTLHNKGIRQWVHPSQRGANTMPTFREYSKDYFDKYRKPDGSKLSGRSNRCNGIVLRRLNETFGDTPLDRITRQMVDEWYANARDTLTAWTFEQAARTLKRIMLAAANEQADGTPPLIPASPCRYRVVKPQSKRRDQPPVTADEINRLAELFPDYQRLAL